MKNNNSQKSVEILMSILENGYNKPNDIINMICEIYYMVESSIFYYFCYIFA